MKIYKQLFVALAVGIFIMPQIAFAAWWNPLSWSIWNIFRSTPTVQTQVATTTLTTATNKKVDTNIKPENQNTSSTQKISQPKPTVESPKTSIVTLPSGAVVEMDASGNIIRTITEAPQQTYPSSVTPVVDTSAQDKQNQINSITANCNVQINQINQQIIDLKNTYYKQVVVIQKQPIPVGDQNGQINKLTNDTNQKIDQLNLQIQQIQLDCQNKINQLSY